MSHLKERKEKICLNCHTALTGRYCHLCGQENLEPKETVWHLIQHFFNDITHFDGKFFSTVKFLLRKPGFLSAEYMAGRRASYLNPIRMYVFTSAIFFLILFSLKKPSDIVNMDENRDSTEVRKGVAELEKMKARLDQEIKKEDDADDRRELERDARKLGIELAMIKSTYGDTTTRQFSKADRKILLARALVDSARADTSGGYRYAGPSSHGKDSMAGRVRKDAIAGRTDRDSVTGLIPRDELNQEGNAVVFGWDIGRYKTIAAYDSTEKTLPDSLRDGWFKRLLMRKFVAANQEMRRDKRHYFEQFGEHMLHSFPKILFWSLPFFALILNVLYFRHKQYYYVDHGIFSIHVYCATFILTLAIVLLNQLYQWVDLKWFTILSQILIFGLTIYIMIYLYKAMRGFYGQRRGKTFLKYLIACFLAFIVNTILLIIFTLISAISI